MKHVLSVMVLVLMTAACAFSQEIKANVTVNVDQLDFEARSYVATLETDLEAYINNTAFFSNEWEGDPIPVEIQIALSGGSNQNYSAHLLVVSRRILDGTSEQPGESIAAKYYDTKWSFHYGLGASLSYNPMVYNSLNTLIDFYMLLIIGHDLDTYEELGGSPAFDKARNILLLGASNNASGFETSSQPGDFTKYNLVSELTDPRYAPFRSSVYKYYVSGLDRLDFNREEGTAAIKEVVDELVEFKDKKMVSSSVIMQEFFDSKALELASVFNNYPDAQVFASLKYLDPTNTTYYDQAKNGELK